MNRNHLQAILDDPASTEAEKAAARRVLNANADDLPLHPDTQALFAALKVARVADLNETAWAAFCSARRPAQGDPLVMEYWYWAGPPSFLPGMSEWDWWTQVAAAGGKAGRPDVAEHARRKLTDLAEVKRSAGEGT